MCTVDARLCTVQPSVVLLAEPAATAQPIRAKLKAGGVLTACFEDAITRAVVA
jgi:ABC-type phosphate transport system ATPase subunit